MSEHAPNERPMVEWRDCCPACGAGPGENCDRNCERGTTLKPGAASSAPAETRDEHKLRLENDLLHRQLNQVPFCPDCRDKVRGQECYRCQLQRAEARVAALQATSQRTLDALAWVDMYYADVLVPAGCPCDGATKCPLHDVLHEADARAALSGADGGKG